MRRAGLILAAAFVALFALLTLSEIAAHGLDALGLVAVLILALFLIGLLGALRHPPGP